jgi:hypothetical protein
MKGMPTHINGLQIIFQTRTEPGWWDGVVVNPDAPFAKDGLQFIVFRNWDGVSNYWGSGIYNLSLEDAMRKCGVVLPREKEQA